MKLYLTRLTIPDDPVLRRKAQSDIGKRLLWMALAREGIDRSALILERSTEGRPYLRYGDGRAFALDFSISHAGAWVVCALSEVEHSPIGVDLERIRAVSPKVWGRYLATVPDEAAGDPYTAILRWTRYEAAFKKEGRVTSTDLLGKGCATLRPIPGYLLTVAGNEAVSELCFVSVN